MRVATDIFDVKVDFEISIGQKSKAASRSIV